MNGLRLLQRAQLGNVIVAGVGALLTLVFAMESVSRGAVFGLGALAALAAFLAVLAGFMVWPHVTVAAIVPFFALLPTLKVEATPMLGPTKDVVGLAAVAAAALIVIERKVARRPRRGDLWVLIALAILIGMYVINLGGGLSGHGFGLAWFHGVRLVSEPLGLLIAGMMLDNPRRTLRWAIASLVVTGAGVALVGLVEQVLGAPRLVGLGYSYNAQVRTISGRLRSFGTLDEPFAYAAFLLLALTAVVFWMRKGPLAYAAGTAIFAGLAFSYVRSAAMILVALAGLWLARNGRTSSAVILLAASVLAGMVILFGTAGATESRTLSNGTSVYLTINGRTHAWKVVLNDPPKWAFGRGVGAVGTAAERAQRKVSTTGSARGSIPAVDSGYFATIADVGLVGFAVFVALFGRLGVLARTAAARGSRAGWFALGILIVLLLDAVTRASFTGFPSAFLGLLFVGLALSAADEEDSDAPTPPAGHVAAPA